MRLLTVLMLFAVLTAKAQNAPDLALKIYKLDSIVMKLYGDGKYQEAIPIALQRVELTKGIDSTHSVSLSNLATFYMLLGKHKDALNVLMQAKDLRLKVYGAEHYYYAHVCANLGSLYMRIGYYEEAETEFLTALNIEKKALGEEHPDYLISLNNLGDLYSKIQRYEQAEAILNQVVDSKRRQIDKNPVSYAYSLNNLAQLLNKQKRFNEAEKLFKETLSVYKKNVSAEHPEYITALNNLGILYRESGRYKEATPLFEEAAKIRAKTLGTKHPYYGSSLQGLATLYQKAGEQEKSIKSIQEAVAVIESALGLEHPDYFYVLNTAAELYNFAGEFNIADSLCLKAMKLNIGKSLNSDIDFTLVSTGNCIDEKRLSESLKIYNEIKQELYIKNQDKEALKQGHEALKAALRINERLKNNFRSEKDKLNILSGTDLLIEKTLESGLKLNMPDFGQTVFDLFGLNKSILLADANRSQMARSFGDLPDSLSLKEQTLQTKLDAQKRKLIDAKSEEEKESLTSELNSLNLEVDAFKKSLESGFPKYYTLKYANNPLQIKDIQKTLTDNSLFLEYFVGESALYLFVISKSSSELLKLDVNKKQLSEQVKALRKAISDYEFIKNENEAKALYCTTAFWFYDKILAPGLKQAKGKKHLIIVPDGELGHLPFETFLTEQLKEESDYDAMPYLLLQYKVSYDYAAALRKENFEHKAQKNNGKLLAFAASYSTKNKEGQTRSNRAPHLRNLRDALQDLPAAKQEVEAISKVFNGEFVSGASANERNFKSKAEAYGIIHLAMHGLLNQRAPILSSLAFTENGDSLEDNFMEAWEISHLKLNADLVVLSACETGYGKFEQGEGIMSIGRAFMYAGVPSLVVSLWQVNDASTSAIMQFFYKNLSKGMDKAEALRQAKLEYLSGCGDAINRVSTTTAVSNPMGAHPAFWAAFVLIGDERPVAIASKNGGMMWWIIGGVALVVVIGGFLALRRRK